MARRRSLNRRWSRRSGNVTELDQDSELIDTANPAWWKDLQNSTMRRPSEQTSFAESTGSYLNKDSLVDGSELQDRWWDNLERTNLQSSRRFSTRRSTNLEVTAQESFVSEGDNDVSIKKRKVLLRARQKQSIGGTENFLKAFDDSDVAQSEPLPSKKRKTQSPSKSDVEHLQRKIRSRYSRSLADADREDTSASNDTDIVVKARPKAFTKRSKKVSSGVYDEILVNEGPSRINSDKNTSRTNDSPSVKRSIKPRASFFDADPGKTSKETENTSAKVIDSNDSGFMGPPITNSLRKRLSTISKKLDLTSDESEGDAGPSKERHHFRQKSKENASFNPFDEILSGELNESTGSGEAATRMSKSLKQSQTLQVSLRVDAEEDPKEVSISKSQLRETEQVVYEEMQEIQEKDRRSLSVLKENSNISKRRTRNATIDEGAMSEWNVPETQEEDPRKSTRRTKNSTIIEESMAAEELPEAQEKDRRTISVLKRNPRDSKQRTASKIRSAQSMQHNTSAENWRSQLFQGWETSDSEEDYETNKQTEVSSNVSHHSSSIKKSLEVSISRLSSTKTSHIRQTEELEDDSDEDEEQEKIRKARSRSLRSHSRALADSAYELPDKERSASPIISVSESESVNKNVFLNTSRQSSKNKRENSKSPRESVNRSILDERSNRSKKSAAARGVSLPRIEPGESISVEHSKKLLTDGTNSRNDLFTEEKAISRKSIANANASQQQDSDESISEELVMGSQSLNVNLSRQNSNVLKKNEPRKNALLTDTSDENANLDGNISDAVTEIAEYESLEATKSIRTESQANTFRKRSTRLNAFGESTESDESINEQELNLRTTNQLPIKKSGTNRKDNARMNLSKQRIESDESGLVEDAKKLKNTSVTLHRSANKSNELPAESYAAIEDINEIASTTVSEPVPVAPALTKLSQNKSSLLDKSNTGRTQKNITDFFPSKFLQRRDSSKKLDSFTSFNKQKLDVVRKELEIKKQQIMAAMKIEETAKKTAIPVKPRPENASKAKKLRPKENALIQAAKPPKVVDKAYIVNGKVYKRPKLLRPKPWVTDRLYRHLWKRLEPKYDLRTRVKSESFVQQLAEVVALTIRRKKYDNYKAEVDALIKEMARLNIIKTRNDFYDFCYEYLPYDFRVKVTPMLLPGSIRIVPYDPATLHTPILPES